MLQKLLGLFQNSEKSYMEFESNQATTATQTAPAPAPVTTTAPTPAAKTATAIGTVTPKKKQKVKSAKKNKTTSSASFAPASGEQLATSLTEKYRSGLASFTSTSSIEYTYNPSTNSSDDAEVVIRAVYKQVFGNAHLMESERSLKAESQFKNGEFGVREFIRNLAKSGHYRKLFWENCGNVTAIEFNFKHLLGRAPESYDEISQHIAIITEQGFDAEIDSYLDSDEYINNFGENFVPCYRGYSSPAGVNTASFTHAFPLLSYPCASDKSTFGDGKPKLETSLIEKTASEIPAIREIPESYPESYVKGVERHIPAEYIMMARTLNIEVNPAPANFSYADNISPSFAIKYGIKSLTSMADSIPTSATPTTSETTSTTTATKTPSQSEAYPFRSPDKQMKKFIDMARNLPQKMR